jgi:hypothetical protein
MTKISSTETPPLGRMARPVTVLTNMLTSEVEYRAKEWTSRVDFDAWLHVKVLVNKHNDFFSG